MNLLLWKTTALYLFWDAFTSLSQRCWRHIVLLCWIRSYPCLRQLEENKFHNKY